MMLAGAGMFSPKTFAFDFGGNAIYIHRGKLEDKPKFEEQSEDHLEPIWEDVN